MVDSGASLHMMRLSSLNHKEKKTSRQSNTIRDIQTANGIVVSDTEAKVYIKELSAYQGVDLVKDSPAVLSLGSLCDEHGCSYSWFPGETPRWSRGKKVIECSIENFVPAVAVTQQNAVHTIKFSRQRKLWARAHHVELVKAIFTKISRTRCIFFNSDSWKWHYAWSCRRTISWWQTSLGCHRCAGDTLEKDTKGKKGIIGAQPRGNHNLFIH